MLFHTTYNLYYKVIKSFGFQLEFNMNNFISKQIVMITIHKINIFIALWWWMLQLICVGLYLYWKWIYGNYKKFKRIKERQNWENNSNKVWQSTALCGKISRLLYRISIWSLRTINRTGLPSESVKLCWHFFSVMSDVLVISKWNTMVFFESKQ